MPTRRNAIGVVCALTCALLMAAPGFAMNLDAARNAGEVGEQADGYIGAVSGTPNPGVKALVQEVNQKRRAEYQRIAKQAGTNPKTVAARAGQRLIKKARKGQYIKPQGSWVQK